MTGPGPTTPSSPSPERGVVRLAERDPDLFAELDDEARRAAEQRLLVRTMEVQPGPWPGALDGESDLFGLLILEGLLSRAVEIEGRESSELAGPGDLITPWIAQEGIMLPARVRIEVKQPAVLALLDRRFAQAVAPWPCVMETLMKRLVSRLRAFSAALTAAHFPRVDDRIRIVLWGYAERWGRVTPEGIVLPLNLTHRDIGGLVGARRPSVTTALGQLMARGDIERRVDGEWVLRGAPPRPREAQGEPLRFERSFSR